MIRSIKKIAVSFLFVSALMLVTSSISFEASHHHGACHHDHCSTCAMIQIGDMATNQIVNDDDLKIGVILLIFIGIIKVLETIHINNSLISLKIRMDC